MKKAIVSFSNQGRENYNQAMLGMIKSAINSGWDGDFFLRSSDGYVDEYLSAKIQLGSFPKTRSYGESYPQASVPYQFKPFLIQEARDAGYDVVVWVDSTVRIESDLTPVIELAAEKGIVAYLNEDHPLYKWTSDYAVDRTRITEDQLKEIPQIMACAIVFDFRNPKCVAAFDEWILLSTDGVSFQNYTSEREGFVAHRNDQSILSITMWKNGIGVEPYGGLCYYPHNVTKEYGEHVYFCNKGIN